MRTLATSLALAILLGCERTQPPQPPAETQAQPWAETQASANQEPKTSLVAQADVREARWEMTPEEVKASEHGTLVKEGELSKDVRAILYNDNVAGIGCTVMYFFVSGKLGEVRISSQRQYVGNKCLEDYDWLKENLQKKYGSPKSDLTHWNRETHKEAPDRYGLAPPCQ